MFDYIAIVAAAVSIVVAILNYLSLKKHKSKLQHAYLDLLKSYSSYLGLEETASPKEFAKSQKILSDLLNNASTSLEELSGKKISASVKLIERENDMINAITFARDSESRSSREMLNFKYPIESNTAYLNIMKHSLKDAYFLSNDIKDLAEGGYYNNTNNYWKQLYRSALVVPITDPSKNELLGFLTFDSPEKEAFSKETIEFAKSIGTLIGKALKVAVSSAPLKGNNVQTSENG